MIYLILLFSFTAHAEPSAANQTAVKDFVKSLSYLMRPNARTTSPNPKIVPNIWGCQADLNHVDECMDRERLKLPAINYCPPEVAARFDLNGCDLQAEGVYKLRDKSPVKMSFQVRNSDVIKRVAFELRFATTLERKPVPENFGSKTQLPYYSGAQAAAMKLVNGKVYGDNDEVLADFVLDYSLSWTGTDMGTAKNEGGKVKLTFPKKSPVEESFVFPFGPER